MITIPIWVFVLMCVACVPVALVLLSVIAFILVMILCFLFSGIETLEEKREERKVVYEQKDSEKEKVD